MLLGARAEGYVKEHLSENLDRATLCRALSTNRTTLSKALILRTGRTLRRFVLDERIRRSKNMLLAEELSVEEIAEKCGFSSAAYFSKVFCEQTAMTPAAYKKSAQQQSETFRVYSLEGETLPVLPWLHDCAVARIDADEEYLTVCFDDKISLYTSLSRFRAGATKLTVRYHLSDPCFFVYRRFNRGKYGEKDFESGYHQYDDVKEFLQDSASLNLYYLLHCVEYGHVILKLWSHQEPHEIMIDLNADRVEYEWGVDFAEKGIVDRMKAAGVPFQEGMSDEEIDNAERVFGFTFPKEIAAFLRTATPTGDLFFNYRDLSKSNVEKLRAFGRKIESGFAFDLSNVPRFLRAMERRYRTHGVKETLEAILHEYENSPKLIPFYGHRCFFDGMDDMPIVSFWQPVDTIFYGGTFENYLEHEFLKMDKILDNTQERMDNAGIWKDLIW
jgi:AraC-like DNA-binding protein